MHRVLSLVCTCATLTSIVSFSEPAFAQDPPQPRHHTVTQSSGELTLLPATVAPPASSNVTITVEGAKRVIRANGIPDHDTGPFPNSGNPNRIAPQTYRFDVPAQPKPANRTTPLGLHNFGIAVDGVPFDPGAAEWYEGRRGSKWQYAALSGAVRLGLDANYAHVQPTGAYHYHGLPTLLLTKLKVSDAAHSPLIGWAADGFPIYARYGYAAAKDAKSRIKDLQSSYRVKSGDRPSGSGDPGGRYDGTFLADYEYVSGLGDLDECNGRQTVTPEFPDGTYAYFLTANWPVIPRCFRGTPSRSFSEERGPQGRRPPHRHPHGGGSPPR